MLNKLNILAIIPARGGSKGIPNKNLQKIQSYSLSARACLVASHCHYIDCVAISTDSIKIRDDGLKHGADIAIMRNDVQAGDHADALSTWQHAWVMAEQQTGELFDISVYLEPTSPFRKKSDIEQTLQQLLTSKSDTALTLSKNPAHFTPEKTLLINKKSHVNHYLTNGEYFSIRQHIKTDYYHRNGLCYAATRKGILEGSSIIGEATSSIITSREVVNIDTPFDLDFARWLFEK